MAPNTGTSRTRRYSTLGAGAALAGALTYIGLADPHRPGFLFPPCPFHAMTGLYCPGCGGLRMTHDLLHGDLAAAVVDNAFLLVGLPLLLAWVVIRTRTGKPALNTPALIVIFVSVATWTIARNLPGFPLVPTLLDG
ncbi:DUF2752 domain-containing protein [Mycolicibacterium flavescens]|uniref:DUF2752 domain-containing protein n=1 Tax=Mycolicibacterium flavescens TaxID=1776 RepID=A0A1E3RRH7_MYCFV|nr:DUF2752 domain-containing protein [Mycolicibacterium flavescens]MCV7279392.1 DUF2752 domain-containing protein [Mycolicibacterium flavescens]ODQ91997.1 hypothetical protein BHQ18_03905 [Mycolicibacterium flavescens]